MKEKLLKAFDADIHTCDLGGLAARAAVEVLAENWQAAGDLYPGDVDEVIRVLSAWKTGLTK